MIIPSRRRSPEPVEGFDGSVLNAGLEKLGNSKEAFGTVEPSGRSGGKRKALIVMATGTGKTRTTNSGSQASSVSVRRLSGTIFLGIESS